MADQPPPLGWDYTASDLTNICEEHIHDRWLEIARRANAVNLDGSYEKLSLRSGLRLDREELRQDFNPPPETMTHLDHFINWDHIDRVKLRNKTDLHPMCLCTPQLLTGEFCQDHLKLDSHRNVKQTAMAHVGLIVSPWTYCYVDDDEGIPKRQLRVCPYAFVNYQHSLGSMPSPCYSSDFFTSIPTVRWVMKNATSAVPAPRVIPMPRRKCIRCEEDPNNSTFSSSTSIDSNWMPPEPGRTVRPKRYGDSIWYYYKDDWVVRSGRFRLEDLTPV